MIKHSLKTKLSLTITFVVLLTVVLISFFSNILLNKQFKNYKLKQLENTTQELVNSMSLQYSQSTKTWDANFVHSIGMLALSDGYLLTVEDISGNIVWDAETCDMTSCHQIVTGMTQEMEKRSPHMQGGFTTRNLDITINQEQIGTMTIKYYSPYFLSENDYNFINGLNYILIAIGFVSLLISIIVGILISKRLSSPILKTIEATKQIADGNYATRVNEKANTMEVLELMDSVNHLADSLEKQENLRKQLTADVAHEFRTPLTTLQTHIEAMLEGIWEPTPERLQSCHDEIVRISKMVVDLENLSKVESDNMNLRFVSTNLGDVARKVVSGYETPLKNKKLQVFTEGTCSDVMADEDRIYQVLSNLLSNAIKYTPVNGKIIIRLSEDDKVVRLSIKDSGIGISESDLPFIFERFYRADKSRNRLTGGSGIGLAIVKSIVAAHGGKVSVSSNLGEGTEFIVEFPK